MKSAFITNDHVAGYCVYTFDTDNEKTALQALFCYEHPGCLNQATDDVYNTRVLKHSGFETKESALNFCINRKYIIFGAVAAA